jgi:hypothetical protein
MSPAVQFAAEDDPSADAGPYHDLSEALPPFLCAPIRLSKSSSIDIVLDGDRHAELGLKFCHQVTP